ncbi:MAG: 3-phosphoshikimate 1-carboxyvinyltransferase, partial [Candidatus Micrarchaeota archaeon]
MRIEPSRISGAIDAPPSKSMMQRALIAAGLADGETLITNPSFCDDALATMSVVDTLGAQIAREERGVRVLGRCQPNGDVLDCGESGTCMRMIAAVAALQDREYSITGRGSLMKRPVGMIESPLKALGAKVSTGDGLPPVKVRGPIHGGAIDVDGSESSQSISGLLMALPICREDSELKTLNLKSRAYVDMTLLILERFKIDVKAKSERSGDEGGADDAMAYIIRGGQDYKSCTFNVEGDW